MGHLDSPLFPAVRLDATLDVECGLLVDDDQLYLRTLQRSLQRRGLSTVLASNARDAMAEAKIYRPAFALVELRLGQDSGLVLIEQLRGVRPDMRILLMTCYASVATADQARKRGADGYLMKPATAAAIVMALRDEAGAPHSQFRSARSASEGSK